MNRFSLLFLFLFFISCNSFLDNDMSAEEARITKQLYDSCSATGKHGYFTVMSIVGRIKTMPISEGLPFEITVHKIEPELLKKKLAVKIIDSLTYRISFYKNEKEDEVVKGTFGKNFGNEKIQLILTKSFNNETTESIKMIDYLIRVHTY